MVDSTSTRLRQLVETRSSVVHVRPRSPLVRVVQHWRLWHWPFPSYPLLLLQKKIILSLLQLTSQIFRPPCVRNDILERTDTASADDTLKRAGSTFGISYGLGSLGYFCLLFGQKVSGSGIPGSTSIPLTLRYFVVLGVHGAKSLKKQVGRRNGSTGLLWPDVLS
jgi:hypothetical protein